MKKRKLTKMSAVLLATALSAATVFSGCNKKVDYDMGDGTQKEGSANYRPVSVFRSLMRVSWMSVIPVSKRLPLKMMIS